jgi:putative NADH-flavin reductase
MTTRLEDSRTMKLLLLGATGGVGIELARLAVEHGHSVTAFVRCAERLNPFAGRVTILQGNLLEPAELTRAMSGHDAVLSCFGPRLPIAKSDAHLLRDFATALTTAMRQAQLRRAIVVSTAFLFKNALIPPAHLFGRLFFPGVVADATDMEAILLVGGLDISLVRPPQLTDKPHTGRFRASEGHLPLFGFSIPRADVADFMLQVAERDLFHRTIVGVCS